MIELPIANLQIPYLNFATPDIINPVEVNMNNKRIQDKVNEALGVLNTLTLDLSDLNASDVSIVPPTGFTSTNVQSLIGEVVTNLRQLVDTEIDGVDSRIASVDTKATSAQTSAQNAQTSATQANSRLSQISAANGSQLVGATPVTGVSGTTVAQQISSLLSLISAIVPGEVNQNAFSRVNNINATSKTDTLNIAAGEGIAITTSPTSKTLTITNTGGGGGNGGNPTMPLPHASTHEIGGSDEIAGLVSAREDIDDLYVVSDEIRDEIELLSDQVNGVSNSNLTLSSGFTTINRETPSYLDISGIFGRSELNVGGVPGIHGVVDPTIINYEDNFLPPFDEWLNYGSYHFVSPYETILDNVPDAWHTLRYEFYCTPNTTYTISSENSTENAWTYVKKQGSDIAIVSLNNATSSATFTTDVDTYVLWIDFVNSAAGTHTFKNPIMTLGSDVKPFAPQHKSSIMFSTELHANPDDNSNADVLFKSSTGYKKLANWKKVVLDGALKWEMSSNYSGRKRVRVTGVVPARSSYSGVGTKYDGSLLKAANLAGWGNDDDQWGIDSAAGYLMLIISNTDSGWGPDYTPSQDEIKAYFNGWRMYNSDAGINEPYNGTGTKRWSPIVNAESGSTTPALPTAMWKNHTPYNLLYRLAKTIVEDVRFSGHVGLGDNNVIHTRSNTLVPFSVHCNVPESAFEVGGFTPPFNYIDEIEFDSKYWPLAGRVADLEGSVGNLSSIVGGIGSTYAPLASPTFTGTPRVGSNVIVHAGNVSTYTKLTNIDNTFSNQINYTVGSGKQYPSIQACINALDRFCLSPRRIVVDDGHVESTSVSIQGFSGASLTIQSASLGQFTVNGSVNIGTTVPNTCEIVFAYCTLGVNASNQFSVRNSGSRVRLALCQKTGTATIGFNLTGIGFFFLENCVASNCSSNAISVDYGSFAYILNPSGTGNSIGVRSNGAIVVRSGGSLAATTAEQKVSGGQIFS